MAFRLECWYPIIPDPTSTIPHGDGWECVGYITETTGGVWDVIEDKDVAMIFEDDYDITPIVKHLHDEGENLKLIRENV